MTYLARYHHVGQEIHLDGLVAIAATGLTASTFHVEGEPAGLVATYLGFRKIDEELADVREYAGISCRVAAGRTANGALVDIHHLVYIVDAFNLLVRHRTFERSVEVLRKDGLEGLVDQRALTRPRHTCNDNQLAQRKCYIYILKIISLAANETDSLSITFPSAIGYLNGPLTIQVLGGKRMGLEHIGRLTLEHYLAPFAPGFRSDVHNPVGSPHHVFIMLYYNHRVAHVAQLFQRVDETFVVTLMQSDGRFVKDIKYVDKL